MTIALIKTYKYKILIGLALCCTLLLSAVLPGFMMIPEAQVPLAASLGVISAGDTVTVQIFSSELTDLYGYQFSLYYDDNVFKFVESRSSIKPIGLIFQRQFPGYLLVGATMIGSVPGYTSDEPENLVCEIVFRALRNTAPPRFELREVNVIDSRMNYTEGLTDWRFAIAD